MSTKDSNNTIQNLREYIVNNYPNRIPNDTSPIYNSSTVRRLIGVEVMDGNIIHHITIALYVTPSIYIM